VFLTESTCRKGLDLGLPLKLWDENILLKTRQADFFDVILVGDGEELLEEFISEWQKLKSLDISRTEALTRLAATVEGAYVPELYEVEYECADGPVKSVKPVSSEVPAVVKKRTFRSRTLAASTVITPISAWENIHMVEAVRSCPEMCRFCLASYSTLPFRSASIEEGLIPAIDRGLEVSTTCCR